MSCSPEVLSWMEKCYAEEGEEEAGEEEAGEEEAGEEEAGEEGSLSQTIPEPAQALNEALGSESAKGTTMPSLTEGGSVDWVREAMENSEVPPKIHYHGRCKCKSDGNGTIFLYPEGKRLGCKRWDTYDVKSLCNNAVESDGQLARTSGIKYYACQGHSIKGLVNHRHCDSGVTEYKVRWDGCGDTEDSWVDAASIPELHKRKYSVSIEKRKRHRSWDSFKRDIKDRSTKTTFGKTHRRGPRFLAPDIRYGYKISCATPLPLKRGPWSTAILCDYDPKRFKGCIGFEVDRGYGDYSYHSYHTMEMHKFKKLISGNQITIKKI